LLFLIDYYLLQLKQDKVSKDITGARRTSNPLLQLSVPTAQRKNNVQAAFEAYRVLQASGQLLIVNDLAQFKPDNVVDYAGQKESGDAKYNVQMLNNGHWAILASCQHYLGSLKTTRHVENTIEQIDRMAEIYQRQDRFFITI